MIGFVSNKTSASNANIGYLMICTEFKYIVCIFFSGNINIITIIYLAVGVGLNTVYSGKGCNTLPIIRSILTIRRVEYACEGV